MKYPAAITKKKEFEILIISIVIIGILTFSFFIYYLNFKVSIPEGKKIDAITFQDAMTATETPLKMLINGKLGFLLTFSYIGNLNWLAVVAAFAYFIIYRKKIKRWEIAFLLMLFMLSFIFSSYGYINPRYGFTLYPILSFITLYCSWKFFDDLNMPTARNILIGFLALYVIANNIIFVFFDPVHMRKEELIKDMVYDDNSSALNYDKELLTAINSTSEDSLSMIYKNLIYKQQLDQQKINSKSGDQLPAVPATVQNDDNNLTRELSPIEKQFAEKIKNMSMEELAALEEKFTVKKSINLHPSKATNKFSVKLPVFENVHEEKADSNSLKKQRIKEIAIKQSMVYSYLKSTIYTQKPLLKQFISKDEKIGVIASKLLPKYQEPAVAIQNTSKPPVTLASNDRQTQPQTSKDALINQAVSDKQDKQVIASKLPEDQTPKKTSDIVQNTNPAETKPAIINKPAPSAVVKNEQISKQQSDSLVASGQNQNKLIDSSVHTQARNPDNINPSTDTSKLSLAKNQIKEQAAKNPVNIDSNLNSKVNLKPDSNLADNSLTKNVNPKQPTKPNHNNPKDKLGLSVPSSQKKIINSDSAKDTKKQLHPAQIDSMNNITTNSKPSHSTAQNKNTDTIRKVSQSKLNSNQKVNKTDSLNLKKTVPDTTKLAKDTRISDTNLTSIIVPSKKTDTNKIKNSVALASQNVKNTKETNLQTKKASENQSLAQNKLSVTKDVITNDRTDKKITGKEISQSIKGLEDENSKLEIQNDNDQTQETELSFWQRIVKFIKDIFSKFYHILESLKNITINYNDSDFFDFVQNDIDLKKGEAFYVSSVADYWYFCDKKAVMGNPWYYYSKNGQNNIFVGKKINDMHLVSEYFKDTLKTPYIILPEWTITYNPKFNEFLSSECVMIKKSKSNKLVLFKVL